MYLIGRIADKADAGSQNGLVEISGLMNLVVGVSSYKEAIATNHGGDAADYDVFEVVSNVDAERIENGDEFDLVWDGDAIDGVDFAVEDAKFIVDFTTDKDRIDGDGVDTATVSIQIYQNDGTTPAGVNASKVVPILKDGRSVLTRVTLTDGAGSILVTRSEGGSYRFPAVNKIDNNNVRVRTIAEVDVLEIF